MTLFVVVWLSRLEYNASNHLIFQKDLSVFIKNETWRDHSSFRSKYIPELQISVDNRDNTRIIFCIFQSKHLLNYLSLEPWILPILMRGHNSCVQWEISIIISELSSKTGHTWSTDVHLPFILYYQTKKTDLDEWIEV